MQNDQKSFSELGFYHQVTQLRADTWGQLRRYTALLQGKESSHREYRRLRKAVHFCLSTLEWIENYTAFPSKEDFRFLWKQYDHEDNYGLATSANRIARALITGSFRRTHIDLTKPSDEEQECIEETESLRDHSESGNDRARPYFELLVVDDISNSAERAVRAAYRNVRNADDKFNYDVLVVPSFEDALIAVLINPNIQACVLREGLSMKASQDMGVLKHFLDNINYSANDTRRVVNLGKAILELRPELDLYMVANIAAEEIASTDTEQFRRIFYRGTEYLEQHHSILRDIGLRYETPFFNALKQYSRKPTGVFHAMPISRAKSITSSNWIGDMLDFYGINIFLAETSATSGGLDSLLQPHGPIKDAQQYASRAFGSRETFFVTNGTSTANKIVVQALTQPNDIVMVDRDCHKSHHYAMVLAGAEVCYLDSYPINEFSMYGAVPLREIKRQLLQYKQAGMLDRVKMLILTNCTFDGIVYNVRRVMEECLAIKPDLIFLWDEAWFAFAGFNPTYRQRTGMYVANQLTQKYRDSQYKEDYSKYKEKMDKLDPNDDATWLDNKLMPDPETVRIRTYTTHSTHKTLTSLRQGSMIHVYDEDYSQKVEGPFLEAYMTHTSTSPNYQIIASLDIGRRQAELEGYGLVHRQLEIAMTLRRCMYNNKRFNKYFKFLVNGDLIPAQYRESGVMSYYDPKTGFSHMEEAWKDDEFVVDPTRITLDVGATGMDGDTFKNEILMDKHGIQINKTSRNTVLFMINIGTTRSSVAYLIEVLLKITDQLDAEQKERSPREITLQNKKVKSLTQDLPPLPDFSHFHAAFRPHVEAGTPEGNIREAYYLNYDDDNCEYFHFTNGEIQELMKTRELVSTKFIIPYPPGFPILVPGQVISREIIDYFLALDVTEIHGYRPDFGLSVFTEKALESVIKKNKPLEIFIDKVEKKVISIGGEAEQETVPPLTDKNQKNSRVKKA